MLELDDCILSGSAVTAPFLRDGLAEVVALPNDSGWESVRDALGGGVQRMMGKLAAALGYGRPVRQVSVTTRDGQEDGGWLLKAANGSALRAWAVATDLDAVGKSYRGSPTRVAQRVLLARGERAGLLANGDMLRLLLCDPARADSFLSIPLGSWRDRPLPPDSWRVLLALAGANALPRLPAALESARLHQTKVTAALRGQARDAIVGFINAVLDRVGDNSVFSAAELWREGLVLVYRLLFILKLESPGETGFSFASTRLWRLALSPNHALAPLVRRHLDHGHDTGTMLESGLRLLFAAFRDGLSCSELQIAPLGGALFGAAATPLLDRLSWGDQAVAIMLDRLIWTRSPDGERVRVHYGSLDVEDLGRVYEALLEQEPSIATEPMVRLRRGKRETVVAAGDGGIRAGRFFLRVGPGRKASGSFYTPHEFVRFLVRETLDAKIAALSPPENPHPAALLRLKIVDPAMGSGHFLVEACRHLGEALLAACRSCDERGLHDRIAALPDPDASVAAYLPSRGYAEARARAICRRLVAVHCLYGVDRNELAVELARVSLWLESYAEGLPLTFLDHRLVHGDALTGPFFGSLSTLPVTGGPLDPLLARGVSARLEASLTVVRVLVAEMDATIGRDIADLTAKTATKARLDAVLHPLRQLARGWSGAAMLRARDADDEWLALAAHVADTGAWPSRPTARQAALLEAGRDAITWELAFPEVFPEGFAAVLGNPPWDVVQHNTKDFVANYDPSVLEARSRTERARIEQAVLARPDAAAAFEAYRLGFDRLKAIAHRLYRHQRVSAGTDSTAGNLDLFRLFAERNLELAARGGSIGVLMPSAFHANEGTTGVRRLYLREAALAWCLSFENRRRVFDIDSRFKFDLIVAHRPGPTASFRCGFYLERMDDAADAEKIMTYDVEFLTGTGGDALTPLELRGKADQTIAERMFGQPERFGAWCARHRIRLGRDLHMTGDAGCFLPPGIGELVLHEGKTFHQYTDVWDTAPRSSVASGSIRAAIAEAAQHYRLVFRDIAQATNERTMIACIAPPGSVFGHTATVEKAPGARGAADALVLCAVFNAFAFDWLVRQKAATHLSLYILEALPMPLLQAAQRRFLARAALRLSCTHAGYDQLWREQIGGERTDSRPPLLLRAQIDAVIADAYGLDRAAYKHVLASFSHRSRTDAPALCLDAFEEVHRLGAEAFCRQYDPCAAGRRHTGRA
nr:DNA methyltransferase [uncultured Rhodopila sp.]